MVKRLYDILLLFKEYFVVAFFLLTSVVLLAANDTSQIRVIRSYAVVAVGLLQNSLSFIPNYFDLRRDNEALRAMNLSLSDEVNRLREGKLENFRLRQMLELKERAEFRTISASVVGKNLQLLRNTITLDVGEKDGVRINMPVINESGLVGKIIGTSSRYAIGQILLNKDIRVSAKVQRSRVDGIIRWTGGRSLALQSVARTYDVQAGDAIITSEYSSLFPAGIRIGTVSATRQIPGSLFQSVEVSPAVDFSRLEEVFVLTYLADTSRSSAEKRIRP